MGRASARRTAVVVCGAWVCLTAPNRSQATVEYARKELRPCEYCHVSGSPGDVDPATHKRQPVTLNNRGVYYQAHSHTFAGYKEIQVMGRASAPLFHATWQFALPEKTRRIAVADVEGDGKLRLVTLNTVEGKPEAATLAVEHWDGKKFVSDFTALVAAPADELACGQFAGPGHPAVIVTGDALWYWDGTTFARKPAPHPLSLLGSFRLKTGDERIVCGDTSTDVTTYRVSLTAPDGGWLVDEQPLPPSAQVYQESFVAAPQTFDKLQMPPLLASGGLFGLWDVRKFGTLFLYYAKRDEDFDTKPNPADKSKPNFVLKNQAGFIAFRNPFDAHGPELWLTPKLPGLPYDVAMQDPATGKPGLLVLVGNSVTQMPRTLFFFTLD